jgi:signal transduction histidine kinase
LKFPADLPDTPLSSNVRHDLFLAFKEAINNVARHSGASEVWIRARLENQQLLLSVEDNGRGLVPDSGWESSGNGLRNMRQRLERAGGQFVLRQRTGGGCIVELQLPLTQGARRAVVH